MWENLKQQILDWRGIGITTVTVTGVVIGLQFPGALEFLECRILDSWFRLRLPESGTPPIVIVYIDEPDIKRLGRSPIDDKTLAKLITNLKKRQPKVIGLNLYRNLPVEPGYKELAKVFASTPNLIGIEKAVSDNNGPAVDPSPILKKLNQVAADDFVVDDDGVIRRHLLSITDRENQTTLTLGTKIALKYLETKNIQLEDTGNQDILKLGKARFIALEEHEGGYVKADIGGYQILANFQRFHRDFPQISITDVLEERIPSNFIEGKIVLIGSIAESFSDKFYTPYTTSVKTRWSGVEIHGNLASQIISSALYGRPSLRGMPQPLEYLWIFLWSCIGTGLGWNVRNWRMAIILIPATSISLIGAVYIFFLASWWVSIISPCLAFFSAGLTSRGYLLWRQIKNSNQQLTIYNKNLENRVRERTQELFERNIALEKAKVDAVAANRAKSIFLANMSHELRTPLNAILGFTQLLKNDNSLNQEQQKNLRIINRAGEHLLSIINDILEMSKIEAGRMNLNLKRFNFRNFIEDLEEIFSLKIQHKNLQLIFEIPRNIPQYIYADEKKLRQVLFNILGNAIKFTERGRVILRVNVGEPVEVSLQISSPIQENLPQFIPIFHYINFEIQDTGPGITQEEINLLFEPFMQTSAGKNSQQGTGLGLSISRKYVQLMGGDIQVSSIVGESSSFFFNIQADISSNQENVNIADSEETKEIKNSSDVLINQELLQQDLSRVSREWLQELYNAAMECSDDKIFSILNDISVDYPNLAIALSGLTTNFQFDVIITLIENYRNPL
jgi:adenylate cyclase